MDRSIFAQVFESLLAMSARHAKLQRLERFRRNVPYISANALAAVLDEVDREGLPEGHDRHNFASARELVANTDTPYGALHQELELDGIDGSKLPLRIVNPFAILWLAFATCTAFNGLLTAKMAAKPPTAENPWSLILYSDEVTPGNVLATQNLRKIQVVYFSFLELGAQALAREDSWFCVTAKRSKKVKDFKGNMAQVFGVILKFIFSSTFNLSVSGIALKCGVAPMKRMFASLRIIVQDGGAHRDTWQCRGDGGTKFCFLCRNVVASKSRLADPDGGALLKCDIIKESELKLATDATVFATVRKVAELAVTMNAKEFEQVEQAYGFRHSPYSLMLDPALADVVKPVSQFMHDWMHLLFVHGVFNITVHLFVASMRSQNVDVGKLFSSYLSEWHWPLRVNATSLSNIFSSTAVASMRKAQHLKCQASDSLSMYPVLAYFIMASFLPSGRCHAECIAFLALADLIDLVYSAARGGLTPQELRKAVYRFLKLFVDAWGAEWMTPKFHWLLHLPIELERYGTLLSCFVHERKHRMVKRYANDVCNTLIYETSILHEVTCHHLKQLEDADTFNFKVGLVKPRLANQKVRDLVMAALQLEGQAVEITTSNEMRFSDIATCMRGDVVAVRSNDVLVGKVICHASANGVPVCIISMWDRKSAADGAVDWNVTRFKPEAWEAHDIIDVLIWRQVSATVARTLMPCHLR
jgi:hypothetical protein